MLGLYLLNFSHHHYKPRNTPLASASHAVDEENSSAYTVVCGTGFRRLSHHAFTHDGGLFENRETRTCADATVRALRIKGE